MAEGYVSKETQLLSRSLRQTLLGLGYSVKGHISHQAPSGERDDPKTLMTLTFDMYSDKIPAREIHHKPSLFIDQLTKELKQYGFAVKISKSRSGIEVQFDSLQPGFVDNLISLQDEHKDKIIHEAEQTISQLTSGKRVASYIPTRPNGEALDKEFAARKMVEEHEAADDSAAALGVSKIVNALREAAGKPTGKGGGSVRGHH